MTQIAGGLAVALLILLAVLVLIGAVAAKFFAASDRRAERRHADAATRVLYRLANAPLDIQLPSGTESPDLRAAGVPHRGRHWSRR